MVTRRKFIKSGALFIPSIFVPKIIKGQAFTFRDKAWSGINTVPASSPPSYIVSENWEGDNSGTWSKQNNSSLVDFDYGTALEGSQSLRSDGDTMSDLPPYAYLTTPFSELSDCYAFFLFKATAGPSLDDYSREIFWLVDYPANAHLLAGELYRFSSTDYRLRVWAGVTGHATTSAGFTLNSVIAVWLRYQQGSGSNGRSDVWWADASDLNNIVKPADGSSHHAHRDDGNYTTGVRNIQLGAIFRSSQGTTAIYDRVRVDDVSIGNNPV